MPHAILEGLMVLLQPTMIAYMLLGIIVGIVFGIIPGLSGLVLLAILIPFTWGMEPKLAMAFLIAGYSICYTGGSITAILVNIPGTGSNAATLLDGFPMAQKGLAGRALGAALGASAFGGIFGGLLLAILAPAVRPIVMSFRAPECFFLIVMGLSFISALGRGSMSKALLAGLLGLIVSFIGYDSGTGVPRFSFGIVYLFDGIKIIPCAQGIFAIPEMMALMYKGGAIVKAGIKVDAPMKDMFEGLKDVFRNWALFLRSAAIGTFVGIIPGVGADVAVWVAYGHAKMISKNPDRFGTGIVEGVIAPESANNAKEGGGFLPTLALGVPGSAGMAILLGAFLIAGIQPGPTFLRDNMSLVFTMIGALIISNLLGTFICMVASAKLVKITQLRSQYLAPFVLCLTCIGAFCGRYSLVDVFLMFGFGMLGWAMRELGYSRPSFFLGFILGGLAERYFNISIGTYGWKFFYTPIAMSVIALTLFGLAFQPLRSFIERGKIK